MNRLSHPPLDNHGDNFGQPLYGARKCLICKAVRRIACFLGTRITPLRHPHYFCFDSCQRLSSKRWSRFLLISTGLAMTTPTTPPFFIARVGDDGTQCDAWPEQPLLLSLEQGGIDWPSSCRNGTCRTCIGVLESGEVRYRVDWPGLSPEEHAEGCVLPCVAYPASDVTLAAPAV